MTETVLQIATESYSYWRSTPLPRIGALAMLAMEQGESGFNPRAVGDRGTAFGCYQDHLDRVEEMLKGCQIDVRTASHLDQLKAANWEITHGWYSRVRPLLVLATTLEEAVSIGVRDFEQSAAQSSDIVKRLAFAEHWGKVFTE